MEIISLKMKCIECGKIVEVPPSWDNEWCPNCDYRAEKYIDVNHNIENMEAN